MLVFPSFSLTDRQLHLVALHPHLLSAPLSCLCHVTKPLKPEGALNRLSMGPAVGENRGLPPLPIVGSFALRPELPSAGDSVAPPVCPLVLAAAQASPAAMHGGATSVIIRSPPLQMGQQVWRLLKSGPGATSQRSYSMADGQIHARNLGGVEPSREA